MRRNKKILAFKFFVIYYIAIMYKTFEKKGAAKGEELEPKVTNSVIKNRVDRGKTRSAKAKNIKM